MSNYLGNFFLAKKERMIWRDDRYKMRCKPWGELFSPRTSPDTVRKIHLRNKRLHCAHPSFHPAHPVPP